MSKLSRSHEKNIKGATFDDVENMLRTEFKHAAPYTSFFTYISCNRRGCDLMLCPYQDVVEFHISDDGIKMISRINGAAESPEDERRYLRKLAKMERILSGMARRRQMQSKPVESFDKG